MKLSRARFDPDTAASKWYHPHGWAITQRFREPVSRVGRLNGQADHPGAMRWWEVSRTRTRVLGDGVVEVFATLREARAWCDEHPRG